MNFVAIKDNKILFPTTIERGNGMLISLPDNALWTPYGYMIPITVTAFEVLRYITGTPLNFNSTLRRAGNGPIALLISADGYITEYRYDAKHGICTMNVPYGKGTRYAAAPEYTLEERVYAGLHMNASLEAIRDTTLETYRTCPAGYKIMPVSTIVKMVNKRGLTQRADDRIIKIE